MKEEALDFERFTESEVTVGKKKVNGVTVKTYSKEIVSANIIEVEVGTTGYMGGDTGHGGRTYLRIKNLSSTDMRPVAHFDDYGHSELEVALGGDCELDTFIEALHFAVDVLSGEYQRKVQMQLTGKQKREAKFYDYLNDVVKLYHRTGKLKDISKLQKKHNVSSISQQLFFEIGLHKTPHDEDFMLTKEFCNEVYNYILNPTKCERKPQYNE